MEQDDMADLGFGDARAPGLVPALLPATIPAPEPGSGDVGPAVTRNPRGLAVPILHLWRFLGPAAMDDGIRGSLRGALAVAANGWSDRWGETMLSAIDPGGPMAPSIEFLHDGNLDSGRGDEIMSALALRGLGGDCAASAVLANGLAILAHGHRAAASLLELSDQWSSLASRQRGVVTGTPE
ncbi:hypothetical protein [Methylobacterium sp. 1030]|uniref:hypothetical protein n=1 Tax=Methylobacterium sp. 1030 TaxID=3156404 RepID=UPI00339AA8F0